MGLDNLDLDLDHSLLEVLNGHLDVDPILTGLDDDFLDYFAVVVYEFDGGLQVCHFDRRAEFVSGLDDHMFGPGGDAGFGFSVGRDVDTEHLFVNLELDDCLLPGANRDGAGWGLGGDRDLGLRLDGDGLVIGLGYLDEGGGGTKRTGTYHREYGVFAGQYILAADRRAAGSNCPVAVIAGYGQQDASSHSRTLEGFFVRRLPG